MPIFGWGWVNMVILLVLQWLGNAYGFQLKYYSGLASPTRALLPQLKTPLRLSCKFYNGSVPVSNNKYWRYNEK